MAPITRLGLLAAAYIASVSAHGHGHDHKHKELHNKHADNKNAASATSSAAASQTSLPACWETCFSKYHASESALCGNGVGASVKTCIDTACKNNPGAAKGYSGWLSTYCPNTATGTGTGTAYSRSTSSVHTTTICPLTEYTHTATWTSGEVTSYSTWTVTSTHSNYPGAVHSQPSAYSPPVQSAPYSAPSSSECPPDVTVTSQTYETVTVSNTAPANYWTGSWGPPAQSQPSPYSPPAQSPTSYSPPAQSPSSYSPPAQSSSQWSPPAQSPSAQSPPAPSPTASSSYVAPSSSSAPKPTGSAPISSAGFGKRGLAYNDAADTTAFSALPNKPMAYNWGSASDGLDSSMFTYIPMLWGLDSSLGQFTTWWTENVPGLIEDGATWFFSFNEPDMVSQSNLSPEAAAAAWMTYMEPHAGSVKLVAPSVTNGIGPDLGINWLTQFISACSECSIAAVNGHWYLAENDVQTFQQQISELNQQTGLPVFVTEYAGTGSSGEIAEFMQEVAQWMDEQDWILGYSYYKVGDGFLNDGDGLSTLGAAYVSGA